MADNKPPCLTVLGGPMAGNRFVLQDGVANILIGSDSVCAFHLPLPGVSAMHGRIAVDPSGVSLWEAGSPRALHVNDAKVEGSAPLRNGDIIWLGTPGEDDVVMLQVILPRLPSLVAGGAPAEADEPEETSLTPEAEAAAVEGETVALDPRALSLDTEAPPPSPEPAPVPDQSVPISLDTPLDAHFASVETLHEPEEAGFVVDPDTESLASVAAAAAAATPEPAATPEFVLADEGMPLVVDDSSSYTLPPPPLVPAPAPEPIVPAALEPTVIAPAPIAPAAMAPVIMPPGFEDETEERLVVADTVIGLPAEPHVVDENAYRAAYDVTIPPTPVVKPAAPAKPAPTPAPAPAVAKPAATPARPARPASPPPAARKPAGPAASQRTEPAEKAEKPPSDAPPAKPSSSSTGLYVGLGIGALVLVGGGLVAMRMMGSKAPAPVAQATPPPVVTATPTPAAATPPPVVEPTPIPAGVETPPPVAATPTPVPTPTPKATPTPTPKPGATPAPATPVPAATPAGPSPEQVKAQQLAGFLTQAEAAMGAQKYDQAIGFYDEALKLEPGNPKATSERAAATAARDAGRRRFVPGRTVVTTDKAAAGNISGFEGAAVQKAPDFLGRIEFEMVPASGLKAGDPWTLKIFVVNEGKKAIRITDLTATAVVNGERSGGAAGARAREVAPQARVQVGEMAGAWKDATQTWSAEVLVTAKGDSLKNTLTWR